MTLSLYGVLGNRSFVQSKNGFTTTDLGTCGALSVSLRSSGDPNLYPYSASSHARPLEMALAYGSISSLLGLQRRPRAGSCGPCTRYPYRCPGPTPSR